MVPIAFDASLQEAKRLGTATIVSNAGALGEVCGDAAPAVRPDDAEGLAELMERLLRSPEERRSWVERGRRRAADFTWRRAAEGILAAYEAALAAKREGRGHP